MLPDRYNHIKYHFHTLIKHQEFHKKRLLQEKQKYFYSKETVLQAAYLTASGIISGILSTVTETVMRGVLKKAVLKNFALFPEMVRYRNTCVRVSF